MDFALQSNRMFPRGICYLRIIGAPTLRLMIGKRMRRRFVWDFEGMLHLVSDDSAFVELGHGCQYLLAVYFVCRARKGMNSRTEQELAKKWNSQYAS